MQPELLQERYDLMVVRYDIPAMPRRDFGEITGNITRISADVSANEGLLGYFLAESLLEDRVFLSSEKWVTHYNCYRCCGGL